MSKLTVLQYLTKRNKLTKDDIIKLLAGRTVETVRSTIRSSGHNYPPKFKIANAVDLAGKIANLSSNGTITTSTTLTNAAVDSNGILMGRSTIYLHEILTPTYSIDDLKTDLEVLEGKKKELKSKIDLLEELGLEEYDDKIIKICSAVSVINPKLTAEEKLKFAQAITEVV